MRYLTAVLCLLLVASCEDSKTPTSPSTGAIVVFDVRGETFRVWLQTSTQIAAARAAQAGGAAKIPNGRIVAGTEQNLGWSWHLEDVQFAQVTIEVCDGKPSAVEQQGTAFGNGRFCPWSATVVRIDER